MKINWKVIPIKTRIVVKNGEIDIVGTLEKVDSNAIVIAYSHMNESLKRAEEKTIRLENDELEYASLFGFDNDSTSYLAHIMKHDDATLLSPEEFKYASNFRIFAQNNMWSINFGDVRHIVSKQHVLFKITQSSIIIDIFQPNGAIKEAQYTLNIKNNLLHTKIVKDITGNM